MSQPSAYQISYDFSDFQASNPSTPLPGDKVDIELAAISAVFAQYKTNIALIQRDDGDLANGSVGIDQVDTGLAATMAASGNPRGPWATSTVYAKADAVTNTGVSYICVSAHTAGTFATDLAADKWMAIGGTAGGTTFTSTAGISATTVQSAIEETYSEKQASAAALSALGGISAVSPVDPSSVMVPGFTAPSAMTLKEVTSAALTLLDDTTVSAMVATLGIATGVLSITAADSSIVVGGTATSATVQRGALTGDVSAAAGATSTAIAPSAVTYAKIQSVTSASKLLGRGSSGVGSVEEIALGTGLSMSGTTLNGSSGAWEFVESVTCSAQNTIDLVEGNVAEGYDYLISVSKAKFSADLANRAPRLQFGTGAGPTYQTTGYVTQYASHKATTLSAELDAVVNAAVILGGPGVDPVGGTGAGEYFSAEILILNPADANTNQVKFESFYHSTDGNPVSVWGTGWRTTAEVVTGFRLLPDAAQTFGSPGIVNVFRRKRSA